MASSLRQLARLIGVDEKSVRKAEKAGVFKDAMRRGDDGALLFLDVAAAVNLWEKSGRKLRGSTSREATSPLAAPVQAPLATHQAPIAVPDARPGGDEEGARDDGSAEQQGAGLDGPSLVDVQLATMQQRERKLRMENDLREGSLVEVDRAVRESFEFARSLRENVLNLPARLAAELAAEGDASRVYARLDGALREALEATAAVMETAGPEQRL